MRIIGVVTVGRSDYGIYRPILEQIKEDTSLQLRLIVAGMHLSPEHGLTAQLIELDGFEITEHVDMLLSSDSPEGIGKSMGLGIIGFSQLYSRWQPDILLVAGDRFEMLAAVAAATPFRIPVAHLHGGESTEGAFDEQVRHAITKLSHLHFTSTAAYRQRLIRMGEEPWRVVTSGAPSLDNLSHCRLLSKSELERELGLKMDAPTLLVTFHPVTLEYEQTETQVRALLNALEEVRCHVIFTYPNADTKNRTVLSMIKQFVGRCRYAHLYMTLGTQAYFSLMRYASAMVGNSSSGIIEAASFKLPVVNIGTRQQGRIRGRNVIDVPCERQAIVQGIKRAMSEDFKVSLADLVNLYSEGTASGIIVDRLKKIELNPRLVVKRFYEGSAVQ